MYSSVLLQPTAPSAVQAASASTLRREIIRPLTVRPRVGLCLLTGLTAVLGGSHAGAFLERPGEVAGVLVAHHRRHLRRGAEGVGQQFLCRVDAQLGEAVEEVHLLVLLELRRQVGRADVQDLAHAVQRQIEHIIILEVAADMGHDKGRLAVLTLLGASSASSSVSVCSCWGWAAASSSSFRSVSICRIARRTEASSSSGSTGLSR